MLFRIQWNLPVRPSSANHSESCWTKVSFKPKMIEQFSGTISTRSWPQGTCKWPKWVLWAWPSANATAGDSDWGYNYWKTFFRRDCRKQSRRDCGKQSSIYLLYIIMKFKTKALTYWNFKTVKSDKNKKTNWKNWRDKKKQMKNTLCRRRTSGKNKAWKKTILVYCKVWFQQAPNIFNAEWVGVGRLWGNPPDTIRQPPIGSGGGGVTPVSFFFLFIWFLFFENLLLDSQYLEESGSHNNR